MECRVVPRDAQRSTPPRTRSADCTVGFHHGGPVASMAEAALERHGGGIPGPRDLARWRTARLMAGQASPAPMPMPWSAHVPALYLARQPEAATCAAAGRHRLPRPSEVHPRYIGGRSPGGDISRGATTRTR